MTDIIEDIDLTFPVEGTYSSHKFGSNFLLFVRLVVQCPDPGSRHLDGDGYISFSSVPGRPVRGVETVMTLRCSSHLTLLGSSERVCQPDARWNGTLTSCDSDGTREHIQVYTVWPRKTERHTSNDIWMQ